MSRDTQAIARVLQTLLRTSNGRAPKRWVLLGCVLLGGYLFAEPWLESRWGLDLPGLNHPSTAAAKPAERAGEADRRTTRQAAPREPNRTSSDVTVDSLIRGDRDEYVSPAGLRYTRGSQHGHRLRHLMAHAHDEPDRPIHGVFDVQSVGEVVTLVDEAYRQAKSGRNTHRRTERDRTIYVVDMRRRVGYIGGQSGARRGRPPASHVQLVLVEDRLITAYPVAP